MISHPMTPPEAIVSQSDISLSPAPLPSAPIADPAGSTTDYPQLSAEFIVEEAPDVIFLACTVYCGTTSDNVGDRPGWDTIPAVVNGAVVELNDDIVSRWGPRVVEFVSAVAAALATLEVTTG